MAKMGSAGSREQKSNDEIVVESRGTGMARTPRSPRRKRTKPELAEKSHLKPPLALRNFALLAKLLNFEADVRHTLKLTKTVREALLIQLAAVKDDVWMLSALLTANWPQRPRAPRLPKWARLTPEDMKSPLEHRAVLRDFALLDKLLIFETLIRHTPKLTKTVREKLLIHLAALKDGVRMLSTLLIAKFPERSRAVRLPKWARLTPEDEHLAVKPTTSAR